MADPADALEKLEAKLLRVADLFKKTQAENRALQQELEKVKANIKDRPKRADTMERELQMLRREREDVRERIEKLIEQIDGLTKEDSEG